MTIIADILMVAGSMAAAFYCFVLGRRLRKLNSLENGVGGAVAVLSAQVDDLTRTLHTAQDTAQKSATTLAELSARAEDTSRRLELQMASLHDIPCPSETSGQKTSHPPDGPVKYSNATEPMFVRHRELGGTA